MSKHTPGEWVFTRGGEGELLVTSVRGDENDYAWHERLEDDVCLVYGGNIADPKVSLANARLIVAAPELLAALEEVTTELFWMEHGPRGAPGEDSDREAFARRVKELRGLGLRAIAKVKGGEG